MLKGKDQGIQSYTVPSPPPGASVLCPSPLRLSDSGAVGDMQALFDKKKKVFGQLFYLFLCVIILYV